MMLAKPVRILVLASTFVGASLVGAIAAETASPSPPAQAPRRDPATMTLKERSGSKAMDEQRVNDCKVPYDRRGDHHRPVDCGRR
jgi:hypothetical protein